MPVSLHWFLPTAGDSRDVVALEDEGHTRPASHPYQAPVARAADDLGFTGVLTPTATWCEDAWVVASSLLSETERLKFLIAFRPGMMSPTLAAQMASTFQRVSRGRLLLNVVTGGEDVEQRRFGDWLSKDERYARTGEFLEILRGAWGEEEFSFTGDHYRVEGATTHTPPDPVPEIYFGGASPAAERVAARHADVYLAWGEPPEMLAERIERVRALARAHGRELRFGVRLHVISRDRAADAWAETERLLDSLDPAAIEAAQSAFAGHQSVGQQRMTALHGGRRDRLVVAPNLWAGIGLVRAGAGTALVGSHEEVAERIAEYHAIGLDEFILSGHPHLEEAYAFGEGVIPILRGKGLLDPGEDAAAWAPGGPTGLSYSEVKLDATAAKGTVG
jgi:alkanesulfonate monooxygenase